MTDLQLYRQLNEMGQNAYAEWQEKNRPYDFRIRSEWNGYVIEYYVNGDGNMMVRGGKQLSCWLNAPAHDMIYNCMIGNISNGTSAWRRLGRISSNKHLLCSELKDIVWDLIHYNNEMLLIPGKLNVFLTACEEYLEKGTYTLNFLKKETAKPLDFSFC